ncbi:AIPR family protein [Gammaproteobacteria bacterium]|nr:AIPR family protein [Gammaproteobacteria bacterium]
MEYTIEEFFSDFREEYTIKAEGGNDFTQATFIEEFADELIQSGFIEGFSPCYYNAQRGMRIDGYWFGSDLNLDLFVADFEFRTKPESLTKTETDAIFNRVTNFFTSCRLKKLYEDLEDSSPEYGLARQISEQKTISKINIIIISERSLSARLGAIQDQTLCDITTSFHIWDMTRLFMQQSSKGQRESLDIDLIEKYNTGIPCLKANMGEGKRDSYLAVVPGKILSSLYKDYGTRLLEQNVRVFLQARSKINRDIKATILSEADMFFAYNNGITATADEVTLTDTGAGLEMSRIKNLQIVNGGQTTASIFHTHRTESNQFSIDDIFVQMKLTVISNEDTQTVVPNISRFSNTQNRINPADFFSNSPYQMRMEELSRRMLVPPSGDSIRETKWFYERSRGQYNDAQSTKTQGERKAFQTLYPKRQMFTKTDLAKFENVWLGNPVGINRGAEFNFKEFVTRIGKEWDANSEQFNEHYFKQTVSRGLIFRATEKIISAQDWYGGYRANIVAYTLAIISEIIRLEKKELDLISIYNKQELPEFLSETIGNIAKYVNDDIIEGAGTANVTEWCKKPACWARILGKITEIEKLVNVDFKENLLNLEAIKQEKKSAAKTQKIDDGISLQSQVLEITAAGWNRLYAEGANKKLLSEFEISLLKIAIQIPKKLPSEKQAKSLLEIRDKLHKEGIRL